MLAAQEAQVAWFFHQPSCGDASTRGVPLVLNPISLKHQIYSPAIVTRGTGMDVVGCVLIKA